MGTTLEEQDNMGTEKEQIEMEQPLNRDVWTDMLYGLFNDHEIFRIASIMNTKVLGFTAKNMKKAPPTLLRKKTIEQLSKLKNSANWLEKWFEEESKKISSADIDFEQYCQKCIHEEAVTQAQSIGVAGILYPVHFNRHKEAIQGNIATGKHPLQDLSDKKLTAKKMLQVKALAWQDDFLSDCYRLWMEKSMASIPEVEGTLKEWILSKSTIETGELAYLASTKINEVMKWNEGEKALLLQMALHDNQKWHWSEIERQGKRESEWSKETKGLERRLKKVEKKTTDSRDAEGAKNARIKELEGQMLQAESLYEQQLNELRIELQMIKELDKKRMEAVCSRFKHYHKREVFGGAFSPR
jgi:hypothetical protein